MLRLPDKPLIYGSRDRFLAEPLIDFDLTISPADRERLRPLAAQVAELAARPLEDEKRELWLKHNQLEPTRSLIFVDLEDGWIEIFPPESLVCEGGLARQWELVLRKEIFWATEIKDDAVIRPYFGVPWVHNEPDWGVQMTRIGGDGVGAHRGSYVWDAPIKTRDDVARLRMPEVVVDRARTAALLAVAEETLGDLLPVQLKTRWLPTLGMTSTLAYWRGLEQIMLDMIDDPDLIHHLMKFLFDGHINMLDCLEQAELLTLNNDGTYVGQAGFGWTRELPQPDSKGKARLCDLWGNAESQETVGVSPAMFAEFVFPYQVKLLERFGLNCYGCCEPLSGRWPVVEKIPRLRRVSVPPASNLADMAEKLGDRYIFSLKPSPTALTVPTFDEEAIRAGLRAALRIARNCRVEIIMKDTLTLSEDPTRPGRWTRIAREEAERV
jgi:hypothetical protein